MLIRILFTGFILFLTQGVSAEAPTIEGAFGIKFGDKPSPEYRADNIPTKEGTLYFVDPPVKNDNFNEYAVLVTNTTNKIYRIYAEKEQSTRDCKTEIIKVKQTLEKIYGSMAESTHAYVIKQKEKEIVLTCKISKLNKDKASLQIKYIDNKIFQESLQKPDANRRDPSGL